MPPHKITTNFQGLGRKQLNENFVQGQVLGSQWKKRCLQFEAASILLTEFEYLAAMSKRFQTYF